MKIGIRIRPEGADEELGLELDLPKKYVNVFHQGFKIVSTVMEAWNQIKGEIGDDEDKGSASSKE